MNKSIYPLICCVFLLASSRFTVSQVYRWTDKDGYTVITSTPPPVEIDGAESDSSKDREPAVKPTNDRARELYGEARASIVESVLLKLFPESTFQWSPRLVVHREGVPSVEVSLVRHLQRPILNGMTGVFSLELEKKFKEEYIDAIRSGQRVKKQPFSTELILYTADSNNRIIDYRRIPLFTDEPVSIINDFSILEWPDGKWPKLRINYSSYYRPQAGFRVIVWDAVFDTQTENLIARGPTIIQGIRYSGYEFTDNLKALRVNADEIRIISVPSNKAFVFRCSDPCVVSGDTILGLY
jgi:hypothetical protein